MLAGPDDTAVKLAIAHIEAAVAVLVALLSAAVSVFNARRNVALTRALEDQKAARDSERETAARHHATALQQLQAQLSIQEQLFREAGPERALLLQHLVTTKTLVQETFAQFTEFAQSRAQLRPTEVLPRATETLDLYADLRRHVKHHYVDSAYPDDLKDALSRGQAHLAALFLDLQFAATAEGDPRSADQRIADTLTGLQRENESITGIINLYTAVRLPPPSDRIGQEGIPSR